MAYAKRERRVLVTTEGRLNEKEYTICTHEGIIVINATRRHEAEKACLHDSCDQVIGLNALML